MAIHPVAIGLADAVYNGITIFVSVLTLSDNGNITNSHNGTKKDQAGADTWVLTLDKTFLIVILFLSVVLLGVNLCYLFLQDNIRSEGELKRLRCIVVVWISLLGILCLTLVVYVSKFPIIKSLFPIFLISLGRFVSPLICLVIYACEINSIIVKVRERQRPPQEPNEGANR